MNRLLLAFYADDFTGATDALEQLELAGVRAALFMQPPSAAQLKKYRGLRAVGVAGCTRSMAPAAMKLELRAALKKLKALGARHVHYKICSTFDSAPAIGNLGCVMEAAAGIFPAPFIPLLAAAPALGRYTIFGTHFARYGIGSAGEIHRLDRHPSISKHPVTPMTEADLRRHLARQTNRKIALLDILKLALPQNEARAALKEILADRPDAVLFDALDEGHLEQIGALIDAYATRGRPLFSIGSSGIEAGLGAHFSLRPARSSRSGVKRALARAQALIGSGSCSPVTAGQIAWALNHGFSEVALDAAKLAASGTALEEIHRATRAATLTLQAGASVIVHTTRSGAGRAIAEKLKGRLAPVLGAALGRVLRGAMEGCAGVRRLCIAGGDTSGFAARALGIEALEMIAPLTRGAPVCRASAQGSPVNGCEVIFKGGQVGAENYFEIVGNGRV